jgi:hypothetical protein
MNWPEYLLMVLFVVGGIIPMTLPFSPWLRIALVPVGCLIAFAVWFCIIITTVWLFPPKK